MRNVLPVSVIIPCFRCAKTIERAFMSILSQTNLPKEIILVDDFSNDDGSTLLVLKQLKKFLENNSIVIKIVELINNEGPGRARNEGWKNSTQPFLAFLDADDSWLDNKLEVQYLCMTNYPNIALSGHLLNMNYAKPASDDLNVGYTYISNLSLLFRSPFPTSSIMLRADIKQRFSNEHRYSEDYGLLLNIAYSGQSLLRIELPLVNYHKALYGESGLSSNLWAMQKGELLNFIQIWRESHISIFMLILVINFSMIKFLKRLLLSFKLTRIRLK
jgi:teichuronic acid biosynthesis glycosyltransferase TuaG